MDLNLLQPNPLQPRGHLSSESLEELVKSIKIHGVLEPLVVAHTPVGYQIIAGERRWRAAKIAGLTTVPVVVKKTSPKGMLEMALVENVQRTDLNPLDRAKAFQRLISEFNLAASEVAERIGKSTSFVSNSIRLLSLPDAIKDGLLSNQVTEGHARALAGIPSTRLMIEAYKILLKEEGSVRRAEELSRKYKQMLEKEAEEQVIPKSYIVYQNEEIEAIRKRLQESIGERSKVDLKRSSKETRLQIVLKGTIEATQERLEKIYRVLADLNLSN